MYQAEQRPDETWARFGLMLANRGAAGMDVRYTPELHRLLGASTRAVHNAYKILHNKKKTQHNRPSG